MLLFLVSRSKNIFHFTLTDRCNVEEICIWTGKGSDFTSIIMGDEDYEKEKNFGNCHYDN